MELPHLYSPVAEEGYLEHSDGMALMLLRESPHNTVRSGQGIDVVPCNCKLDPERNICRKCERGGEELPCSMFCE